MLIVSAAANLLGGETSPYLLQHQDNPVHWMPWGAAALAQARAEDKPILLSIGYAACHWCHVMARESFEDPEIAALINRLYIAIKVDREERPDLDQLYQGALALMGEHGGWPLTMFLTPDGAPFWGGTYFPPRPRYDRPGFGDVLTQVANTYRRHPDMVAQAAAGQREALGRLGRSEAGGSIGAETVTRIAERLVRAVDPIWGGLGDAPKFPHCPVFELLWRAWLRTGRAPYRAAVITTLNQMCQGGIYDHLAGGFARYSTDSEWLVPHFEKMLYDNAALIDLLTLVWRESGDPLYAERVAETVDWVLREMVGEGGGFASSLDADSDHEEGKFTVWREAEIDAVLGAGSSAFKAVYDVTPGGNWEGTTILNRRRSPGRRPASEEAMLALARSRLLAERAKRVRPGWDDKVLADWNGLMIGALARAGMSFGRADWVGAAERAFGFVRQAMTVNGRLLHSRRRGLAKHTGLLDDYAALAGAALALYQATMAPGLIAQARSWVDILDRHFWDDAGGGYFLTPDDGETMLVRTKSAGDLATPGGNGMMVGVLAQLYQLTGEPDYRERAEAVVRAFSGELTQGALGLATLLNAVETLNHGTTVVIVGRTGAADTRAMHRVAALSPAPDIMVMMIPPETALPSGHPASGKGMVDDRVTAYVCSGQSCGLPVTEPAALAAALGVPTS